MITEADLPPLPSLVVGTVHHTRHRPMVRSFDHAHYQWLMDLSAAADGRLGVGPGQAHGALLPSRLGPLARFHPADHLDGDPTVEGLIANVHRTLDQARIEHHDVTRVVLLAHARQFGHVFDPMSAFFCFASDGSLRAVVVEVHNTYGERHAYPVQLDDRGRARVEKGFYVSPFNDVSGDYSIRVRLHPSELSVTVVLASDGQPVLTATVGGRCEVPTRSRVLRTIARHPFMTHKVSALIRRHGIALWMRRLPIQPRPRGAKPQHQEQL